MPQDVAATEDGIGDFYSRQNIAVIMGSLFQPAMQNQIAFIYLTGASVAAVHL